MFKKKTKVVSDLDAVKLITHTTLEPTTEYLEKKRAREEQYLHNEKVLALALLGDPGYPIGGDQKNYPNKRGIYYYTSHVYRNAGLLEIAAQQVLLNWHKKGWYDYANSIKTGWLTDSGGQILLTLIRQ